MERATPCPRIFVFSALSAMRLPITPWTDASSPGSPPANCDWLRLGPPHLRSRHRQSSLLGHARTSPESCTPNNRFVGGVAAKAEKSLPGNTNPNPVSSEEEKIYELSNMLL